MPLRGVGEEWGLNVVGGIESLGSQRVPQVKVLSHHWSSREYSV